MLLTTAGKLAVNNALPEQYRSESRVLDKKGLDQLLTDIAQNKPEEYRDIVFNLSKLGRETAYRNGSFSFDIKNFKSSPATLKLQKEINDRTQFIYSQPSKSQDQKEEEVIKMLIEHHAPFEKQIMDEATREKNPLAMQVLSGSR